VYKLLLFLLFFFHYAGLLLSIPKKDRIKKLFDYLFDSKEFLSDYGIIFEDATISSF
jgi:hypothetical protein